MRKPVFKYHRRGFLNKNTGVALFESSVDKDSNTSFGFDANFTLSDCSRNINLDFYVWEQKDFREKIAKVDLLISELFKFKEAMIKCASIPIVKKPKREEKKGE